MPNVGDIRELQGGYGTYYWDGSSWVPHHPTAHKMFAPLAQLEEEGADTWSGVAPDRYTKNFHDLLLQSGQYQYDDQYTGESRGVSDSLLDAMRQRAMGNNLASEEAARQSAQGAIGRQYSMARSGPGYDAAALRQGTMNAAGTWQGMQGQLALAKAQEQQAMQDAYLQAMGQRQGLEASYGLTTAEMEQNYRMALEQQARKVAEQGYGAGQQAWQNRLNKMRAGMGMALDQMALDEQRQNSKLAAQGQALNTGGAAASKVAGYLWSGGGNSVAGGDSGGNKQSTDVNFGSSGYEDYKWW